MTQSINTPDRPVVPNRGYLPWLVIGWLWVGIPLAWGVTQTVKTSLKLFEAGTPTTAPAPPAGVVK